MQVLVKTRALDTLTEWTRSIMKEKKLTQVQLAQAIGISRSNLSVKFVTGMTYNDVEKIAAALDIPKPDLAAATLYALQKEIRSVSGTPEAANYGMEVKPMV